MTGIECKLRSNEFKATEDQIKNCEKEIRDDLMRYIKVGIKDLMVVTNLDQDDALTLENLLHTYIKNQFNSLKVIHKSVPDLVKMIDELIKTI